MNNSVKLSSLRISGGHPLQWLLGRQRHHWRYLIPKWPSEPRQRTRSRNLGYCLAEIWGFFEHCWSSPFWWETLLPFFILLHYTAAAVVSRVDVCYESINWQDARTVDGRAMTDKKKGGTYVNVKWAKRRIRISLLFNCILQLSTLRSTSVLSIGRGYLNF